MSGSMSTCYSDYNYIDPPVLMDTTTSGPTTIAISWTQSVTVDRYAVSYIYTIRRCGSGRVTGSEEISDGNARSFTLTNLEEDSDYTITLLVITTDGLRIISNHISATTDTAGI